MKLYGTPPTRVLRPLWLVKELELECEMVTVDLSQGEHLTPEFLALNPAGKVPVLVDGEFVLTESVAIALYLAEKEPKCGFIPEDLQLRATMYQWLFFLVSEIEQPLWRMARHTWLYPEEGRLPGDVALAREECRRALVILENHMENREFVVGESLSVADFMAAYTLDWAKEADCLNDCPRLNSFLQVMYQRPKAPPTIAQAFADLNVLS